MRVDRPTLDHETEFPAAGCAEKPRRTKAPIRAIAKLSIWSRDIHETFFLFFFFRFDRLRIYLFIFSGIFFSNARWFHDFSSLRNIFEIFRDKRSHVLCARKSVIEQRGEKKLKTINFCSTNVSIPNRSRSQIDCTYTRYNDSCRLLLSSRVHLHTLVRASLKIKRAKR